MFREEGKYGNKNKGERLAAVRDFHGHECGGLTIGYKAAQYAIKLLELTFSDDEQVVCNAENDSCSGDAIQVLLGCSMGKGNLLFHITGKQAFSFYNRKKRPVCAPFAPAPPWFYEPGGILCLLSEQKIRKSCFWWGKPGSLCLYGPR